MPGSKLHRSVGALLEYMCICSAWLGEKTQATLLLSVPDDLVHEFRPVTDKRDVAICII